MFFYSDFFLFSKRIINTTTVANRTPIPTPNAKIKPLLELLSSRSAETSVCAAVAVVVVVSAVVVSDAVTVVVVSATVVVVISSVVVVVVFLLW